MSRNREKPKNHEKPQSVKESATDSSMTDMSMKVPADWICLGRVIDAHGLNGELKVFSHTEEPKHIGAYGPLSIMNCDDKLTIIKVRSHKNNIVVVRSKELLDRDTAELLKGQDLYVSKQALPQIDDQDIFYVSELKGLALFNSKDEKIGDVEAVHNFGAGDILEVTLVSHRESIMIPFLKEWIKQIDFSHQKVVIDEVYLQEYLKPFKPSDERWTEQHDYQRDEQEDEQWEEQSEKHSDKQGDESSDE